MYQLDQSNEEYLLAVERIEKSTSRRKTFWMLEGLVCLVLAATAWIAFL